MTRGQLGPRLVAPTAPTAPTAPPAAARPVRRAYRSADDRLLGGVASGLAEHLGTTPLLMRGFFLLSTIVGGFGVLLYAGLWLTLPLDTGGPRAPDAPGLEAAGRQGRRPRAVRSARDTGVMVAIGALALAVLVVLDQVVGGVEYFWPLVLAALGVVALWRQADEAQRERWLDSSGRVDLTRAVVGRGGVASYARLATGVGLLATSLVLFAVQSGDPQVARDVVVAGVLGTLALALALGPWLFRLAGDLTEERAARVRQEERADVAAHLHDSVLQTLALIQKNARDAATVGRLSRAQERDLRQWLYGEASSPQSSLAAALRTAAAEVEDSFGVPVEVVVVGDATSTERSEALVMAAREAMVNAAKHSGAPRVDVYAELGPGPAEVFVRDRGRGFDPEAVPEDRLGVRRSIEDRMRRRGGAASLRTTTGAGTEVHLTLPTTEEKS